MYIKLVQTSLIFMQFVLQKVTFMHMELNNPQVCHSLTPKCSLVQTYPLNS
jgi:hypothetical protein